jgi:colicin import membrane protein
MRIGLGISAIGHGVVLLWSIVSFAAKPYEIQSVDMPVDIITASEFSQLTKGVKTAEKVTVPKPMAEKVADPTPPKEDVPPKVVEKKQEIAAAAEPPPPPKQVEPKPTPPAKAEPDPAIEALEQMKKNEPKKTEPPKPEPPKQQVETPPVKKPPPPKPQPKFDPTKVAALLDKRDPRRQSITGAELNPEPSLGGAMGSSATLSANEMDMLRSQVERCWHPPVGLANAKSLKIALKVNFNQNGTLQRDPALLNRDSNPMFQVAAESAIRAIIECQPYRLPIARYDAWKEVEFAFDPRDLFR